MTSQMYEKLNELEDMLADTLAMAPEDEDCEFDEEAEMYGTMQSLYEEIMLVISYVS